MFDTYPLSLHSLPDSGSFSAADKAGTNNERPNGGINLLPPRHFIIRFRSFVMSIDTKIRRRESTFTQNGIVQRLGPLQCGSTSYFLVWHEKRIWILMGFHRSITLPISNARSRRNRRAISKQTCGLRTLPARLFTATRSIE